MASKPGRGAGGAGSGQSGRPGPVRPPMRNAHRRYGQPPARRTAGPGRRPLLVVAGVGGLVAVAVLVLLWVGGQAPRPARPVARRAAPASLVRAVTHLPAAELAQVGRGVVIHPPTAATGSRLRVAGKPELLYVGAEYCPFCAFERWSLVVALGRFGRFSHLGLIHSAVHDGNVATFTFYGSHYASPYLAFVPKELYTNVPAGNFYQPLQHLTPAESAIFAHLDSHQDFPFLDFGNRWTLVGIPTVPTNGPAVLTGLGWTAIAADLRRPSSPQAQGIIGTANLITAGICALTGQQPASVCQAPTIRALEPRG